MLGVEFSDLTRGGLNQAKVESLTFSLFTFVIIFKKVTSCMLSRQASAHEVVKWVIFAKIQVTDRQIDRQTDKNIQLSLCELKNFLPKCVALRIPPC